MPNSNPLLAARLTNPSALRFPVGATPKIDGIRCLITPDGPRTRSLKSIPNHHIRALITSLPVGSDGELTSGPTFQSSTSAIMSASGTPDFRYTIFDNYLADGGYRERVSYLITQTYPAYCNLLVPTICYSLEDLSRYYSSQIVLGHEGICFRLLDSPYKHGRSTEREQILMKWKQIHDAEGTIVDFVPLYRNHNAPEINALGFVERSSHKANKSADECLGALVVSSPFWSQTFEIGTGFTADQRKMFWASREFLRGKLVKFKYHNHNIKDKPREPVFIGFRDPADCSQSDV